MTILTEKCVLIAVRLSLLLHILYGLEISCNNETSFACFSKDECIPLDWRCDGVPDCKDSSDERRCKYLHDCEAHEFNCNDGDCIPAEHKCDGQIDCLDGRDELSCESYSRFRIDSDENRVTQRMNITCDADSFACRGGRACLHKEFVCDGESDCPLGDDEENCAVQGHRCPSTHFRCVENNLCIPKGWVCDGAYDCVDKSDENKNLCYPAGESLSVKCADNEYHCKRSNMCIALNRTCDGHSDCPHGDDERGECEGCDMKSCSYECVATALEAKCVCEAGKELAKDGSTCILPSPCDLHFRCSHFCNATMMHGYVCECDVGFKLAKNQHRCIPKDDPTGGQLFISSSNQVRSTVLHSSDDHTSRESVLFSVHGGEFVTHIAWDYYHQALWAAVDGSDGWRIAKYEDGQHVPMRRGYKQITGLQYDWINGNVFFSTIDVRELPTISVCRDDMLYCSVIIWGVKTTFYQKIRRQVTNRFSSLSLNPRRGLLCWIDVNRQTRIRCANADGTGQDTLVDEKLTDPKAITWDIIRSDVYIGDAGNELLERINYDTRERLVICKVFSPTSMVFFNSILHYAEPDFNVVKSVDVSDREFMMPYIERSVDKPLGLALNHSAAQADVGVRPCNLEIACDFICVSYDNDGIDEAKCICPDGYYEEYNGSCTVLEDYKTNLNLDPTYMSELCVREDICGGPLRGSCDYTQFYDAGKRITCKCLKGFFGDFCEVSHPMKPGEYTYFVTYLIQCAVIGLILCLITCIFANFREHIIVAILNLLENSREPRRIVFNRIASILSRGVSFVRSRGRYSPKPPSTSSFTSPVLEGESGGIVMNDIDSMAEEDSVILEVEGEQARLVRNFENPVFQSSATTTDL